MCRHLCNSLKKSSTFCFLFAYLHLKLSVGSVWRATPLLSIHCSILSYISALKHLILFLCVCFGGFDGLDREQRVHSFTLDMIACDTNVIFL